MEKLLPCLKIYETKYSREKLDGSFAHLFPTAHPVHSYCCNLPSKCSVISTGVCRKSLFCSQEPWGCWWGMRGLPLLPPCASRCQTNFPQRVFSKSGGILCQWQWIEEKQPQKEPFIWTPSLLLCWFGAKKQSLDVLARGMEIYYICCVLWVQFSGSLLRAGNSSILGLLQMYWEKPTVLCHCTYFCISPSKNNLSWKDMNFVCAWKKNRNGFNYCNLGETKMTITYRVSLLVLSIGSRNV